MHSFSKIAIAAALSIAAATPAMAAWNGGKGLDEKIAQLDQRVKGAQSLDGTKATYLQKVIADLQQMHKSFSKGGISAEEQSVLEDRIGKAKQQIDKDIPAT